LDFHTWISTFFMLKRIYYTEVTNMKTTKASTTFGGDMIDLSDPTLDERLLRRTAEGRYEISEIELVKTIRVLQTQGNMNGVRRLSEVLLQRCAPAFQRHTQGLRHRPDLREEAIANMAEHLLREAQDPHETFMTQNFIHYLRCLCADEFNRILRQEGLYYRRDDEGRPSGRPQHVPRTLMEPLRPAPPDDEGGPTADVADPHDQYEHMHAEVESQRILTYLSDPLDRMIMVLRAIEGMKWDDIAILCKRTERTVRLRYERARSYLRDCILKEQQVVYTKTIPARGIEM
jgi:DNA-directed RNA polymerase specialized sigma24 family protein